MREDKLMTGFTCICLDVPFGHHETVVKWLPTDTTAECLECQRIWDLDTIRYTKENGGWE
jgi:hypothetical protein